MIPVSTRERIPLVRPKDCEVSFYCGSGNGGQARNRVNSAIQIKHTESGAIGRCSDSRSQMENKKNAFLRLIETPKFKVWLAKRMYEIHNQETIDEAVERQMNPKNIETQFKDADGRWVVDESTIAPV